jgi:hypothetical protein
MCIVYVYVSPHFGLQQYRHVHKESIAQGVVAFETLLVSLVGLSIAPLVSRRLHMYTAHEAT